MKARILAISLGLLVTAALPARSAEESPAIPYRCEDSVVTKLGYYFENKPESGIYAEFDSRLGVETFQDRTARVVDRSSPVNTVMDAQAVGDKVQVCLVAFPETAYRCDPKKDSRGRFYRVFNYRLNAAYMGPNSGHLCGGA
jgi:hypothetical protein